ncbi:unnamed protein product, partial [Meganyctiphanes norvegica]
MHHPPPRKDRNPGMREFIATLLTIGPLKKSKLSLQFLHYFFFKSYVTTVENPFPIQHIIINCFIIRNQLLNILDLVKSVSLSITCEKIQRIESLIIFSFQELNTIDAHVRCWGQIHKVKTKFSIPNYVLIILKKMDLEKIHPVAMEEAQTLARQLKIPYIECSAKIRMNVDQSFYELVRIVRKFQLAERPPAKPASKNNKTKCIIIF